MIKGLSFTIPNAYQKFFTNILHGINIEKYTWRTGKGCTEVYTTDFQVLLEDGVYSGGEFDRIIHSVPEYYVVFADIAAFEKEASDLPAEDWRLESDNCKLVVTCCDCEWAEVFCRDPDMLAVIRENAVAHQYTELVYITEENENYGYLHSVGERF